MKISFVTMFLFITSVCFSQVIINEIQSSNTSTVADNFGEFDDWIEIYNPSNTPVDIGGLVLKDNVDTWQIPANTIILPNEFLLLWADDEESQGEYHTNFKLSAANGEFLGLFESDGLTEIESVNIPPLSENQSYVKCLNGEWSIINDPTPLAINDCQLSSTQEIKNDVLIYPTVSNGYVHIDLQEATDEVINVYLFSINGKLVLERKFNSSSFTVDLSNLNPDVYIVKVIIENDSFLKKIILVD